MMISRPPQEGIDTVARTHVGLSIGVAGRAILRDFKQRSEGARVRQLDFPSRMVEKTDTGIQCTDFCPTILGCWQKECPASL
jgi:hypothetical protein